MAVRLLPRDSWVTIQSTHHDRVDRATSAHRARRQDARAHPVEDFLFTYYSHRPAQLRRWHPGVGVALEGASRPWRFYVERHGASVVDVEEFRAARGEAVRFVRDLLGATLDRPAHLGCFGLHEWAMVYRLDQDEVRHADWPLRLGGAGTDEVVESHTVRCSHYDAYRFFTPSARPLNSIAPQRDTQVLMEQPGCLHAGMDVYKWAYKLTPAVPSELVMDCFDLARDVRLLDMQAAPYDLSELDVEPVRIETAEGKAEYVRRQRAFAARGQDLRRRLLAVCETVLHNG
ncbi:3-methyladenine DNA glycosylase [Luteipulveratus sp. YIM 133132]|uniref:3-methyladenine DNA glycosylase n=1 Tax=Luteipulveratus flavus TaxID=3031728 RepID=UPI0023B08AE2|nr:3-methyladenine DNA glycosylase [Luteipulveratus sp. YIM 133132]MDE9366325.1 3-methyladenine DNA glycosylase [Luteipulveratus sp. YIM 133132]